MKQQWAALKNILKEERATADLAMASHSIYPLPLRTEEAYNYFSGGMSRTPDKPHMILNKKTTLAEAAESMDETPDCLPSVPAMKLSKAKKRNLKKKAIMALKKAEKANRPQKPVLEPRLPATIIPPKPADRGKFSDADALLTEIKRRLVEKNAQTLRISPIPKNCPPSVLLDFCPSALTVRMPAKDSCRYAFLEFRSRLDAQRALTNLNGRQLGGRPVVLSGGADGVTPVVTSSGQPWCSETERTLEDFDLMCIYVCRLPRSVTRTDLAQLFRTASGVKFPTLADGTCKGFCLLKYRSQEDALLAFTNLDGTLMKGVPICVNFPIKHKSNTEQPPESRKRRASESVATEEQGGAQKHPHETPHQAPKRVRTEGGGESTKATTQVTSPGPKIHQKKLESRSSEFSIKKRAQTPKKSEPKLQSYQLARRNDNKKKRQQKKRVA
ncbi:unnamed protein product [Schistocephalus solidus]|uniref:Nucleolin n=3 Tax=Schistocephalus solidus TaxID=70667 RepID=A0A183T108_SCHSO|nr:unnamed protein product [Schistocephalus solidus]